jgi:hypothetical protein
MTSSVSKPCALSTSAISVATPAAQGRKGNCFAGVEEPKLGDLMADPILERLMASDGVAQDQLMRVIADARQKLTKTW